MTFDTSYNSVILQNATDDVAALNGPRVTHSHLTHCNSLYFIIITTLLPFKRLQIRDFYRPDYIPLFGSNKLQSSSDFERGVRF